MAIKTMNLGDSSTTVNLNATGTVVGSNIKSKGSATQPVYFDANGVAQNTTYTLGKSVPADAVFTDTNTWRGIQDNLTSTSNTDSLSANQGKVLNDKIDNLRLLTRTASNRYISDALNIDLNNPDGENNKIGYVYRGGTSNLPDDCDIGIREIYYYNSDNIWAKITGWSNAGYSSSSEWTAFCYGGNWGPWVKSFSNGKDKELKVGDKIKLYENSEGGNIAICSPNGVEWEMDAYNDNIRLYNIYNGGYKGITLDRNCNFLTDGNVYARGSTVFLGQLDHGAIWSNANQQLYLRASAEQTYYIFYGVYTGNDWVFTPITDNKLNLGMPNARWRTLYSVSGTINTSDRKLKKDITELLDDDKYIELFKRLIPVSYKFKDGTSGRTHIGFISQDVEAAMKEVGLSDLEFAGFCKDQKTKSTWIVNEDGCDEQKIEAVEDEYVYSLRYEEFIALNTKMIQIQQKEIDELKNEVDLLKQKIIGD